jgi:hypothetical protein
MRLHGLRGRASRLKPLLQWGGGARDTTEIRGTGPALCRRVFTPDAFARAGGEHRGESRFDKMGRRASRLNPLPQWGEGHRTGSL